MKKFSRKTFEERKEEEGSELPKVETQEVRLQAALPERLALCTQHTSAVGGVGGIEWRNCGCLVLVGHWVRSALCVLGVDL